MVAGRRGRPRRRPPPLPSPAPRPRLPISVGNCTVDVEGCDITCESHGDGHVLISTTSAANIKISAVEDSGSLMARKQSANPMRGRQPLDGGDHSSALSGHSFVVLNPKDTDGRNKLLIQKALKLYMKELPNMNYAANTGKQSMFLEKCVSGKYKTLILISSTIKAPSEVIAAISYQIIPSDMQYAEIPLAAVSSGHQRKGIGCLLYSELRNRLYNVGILSIFCWADKESEAFWLKQGFAPIGEVDGRGRVRKIPVRADIRKALCFPGDSTLMISQLRRDIMPEQMSNTNISFPASGDHHMPVEVGKDKDTLNNGQLEFLECPGQPTESAPIQLATMSGCLSVNEDHNCFPPCVIASTACTNVCSDVNDFEGAKCVCEGGGDCHNCFRQIAKRRNWEASLSSIKSKRVKGSPPLDGGLVPGCGSDKLVTEESLDSSNLFLDQCKFMSLVDSLPKAVQPHLVGHTNSLIDQDISTKDFVISDLIPKTQHPNILFMNIADENKKMCLTKIVEELGGSVTCDGSSCTHIVTGKARKTLNFCTALCSGAWVLSSSWLKESYREGKFLGESNFVLEDTEYASKYNSELKDAIIRARAKPGSLLKGYIFCLAKHIQPPSDVLRVIIRCAGGQVIPRLTNVQEPSRTIFIACEEDMEDAMLAAKRGIFTYGADWFMDCIMSQELDFEAPQFAESL